MHSTNMAQEINNHAVKIIEECQVAPSPGSLPSTTLPLCHFDIPWFYCHPLQRIFFYEYPYPTNHFLQDALPNLKHSLSLTLQHFFPFASNLIFPPSPHHPFIRYLSNFDSLPFIVAESKANFSLLISDSPQDVRDWHPFVPTLPSPHTEDDGARVFPLMAIQVTIISNSGFAICLTFNHVAGDGMSLHHFMKFWASVCKAKGDLAFLEGSISLPFHDRTIVKDPKGLRNIYLQELRDPASKCMEFAGIVRDVFNNKVRATIVLTRVQIEKLKKWFSLKCTSYGSGTLHMSTYVVTCSLIWVCLMKSEHSKGNHCVTNDSDELCYFTLLGDCRGCAEFSLPSTYFGNCLATRIVAIKRSELLGGNGMVEVVNAIERKIRDLKSDPLRGAEKLMSDYRELGGGKSVLVVAGSPKLAAYDTDFGWGRPTKSEAAHLDSTGSISLSDCRDKKGAIEIGLALDRIRMNNFIKILEEHLNNTIVCE